MGSFLFAALYAAASATGALAAPIKGLLPHIFALTLHDPQSGACQVGPTK
jgi:hypothetical protein